MDIKHKKAYARLKLYGTREPLIFNDGTSLVQLLAGVIPRALMEAAAKYGKMTLEIDFEPIQLTVEDDPYQGLNPEGFITLEGENPWNYSPMNSESPTYDELYYEYAMCGSPSYRGDKTPEQLNILRRHVESKYRDTQWWPNYHSW